MSPLRRLKTQALPAHDSQHRQSGQALILGLMLLAIGVGLMLLLAGSGTLLSARQRLVQAADASAYSAAIWRARVLNTLAYSNRTIVAQEVAIAQAVTLSAWARHFETLAGQAELLATIYPPAAGVLATLASSASASADLSQRAMSLEIGWRAGSGVGLTALLEQTQALLLRSANGFGLSAVAQEVARANDPRFSAFALSDRGSFASFVRHQTRIEDRASLREVVLASLDPFTGGSRDRDLRLPLPSSCVGRSTQLDKWTLWMRKRGSTELSDDLDRWQALDTTSLHDWRGSGLFGLGACRDLEALPLGWGAAAAGSRTVESARAASASSLSVNPLASRLAGSELDAQDNVPDYRGLARPYDLSDRGQAEPVSRVAVLVRADRTRGLVDTAVARLVGSAEPTGSEAGAQWPAQLWALAAAEVYFRAPPGAQRIEYASLFSPFWQARLVSPTDAERAEADRHAR